MTVSPVGSVALREWVCCSAIEPSRWEWTGLMGAQGAGEGVESAAEVDVAPSSEPPSSVTVSAEVPEESPPASVALVSPVSLPVLLPGSPVSPAESGVFELLAWSPPKPRHS